MLPNIAQAAGVEIIGGEVHPPTITYLQRQEIRNAALNEIISSAEFFLLFVLL